MPIMGSIVVSQNPEVEVLTPSNLVTTFEDRVFKKVIKWKSLEWALLQCYPYLWKKRRQHRLFHIQREGRVRKQKTVICKPRRKASKETNPANTLILDFQLFMAANLGSSTMAVPYKQG